MKTYPSTLVVDHAGHAVGAGGSQAWWSANESLIHHGDLEQVLGHRADRVVVVVGLADGAEERHWAWVTQLPVQTREHEGLSLLDLLSGVSLIDHEHHLGHGWRIDLLVLGSNEEGGSTDELKLADGDDLNAEETIDNVDGKEQGLREQVETLVDLDEPVKENRTVGVGDLGLAELVSVVWSELGLRELV